MQPYLLHSSVLGPRPPGLPSHSLWKSQPSSRWRYVARTSRYSGASSASRPGKRTGDSLMSSCSRGPRWQSYKTKSRLAAYGTMRLVLKRLPAGHNRRENTQFMFGLNPNQEMNRHTEQTSPHAAVSMLASVTLATSERV